MKIELIALKVQNIREAINIRLGEIDAGPLGNNPLSQAVTDVMLSQMLREIANKTTNKAVKAQVLSAGKQMMQKAAGGLIAGWEDGDDICPPYFHFKFPHQSGPQPEPWFNARLHAAAADLQPLQPVLTDFGTLSKEVALAELLRITASLTTSKDFNQQIKTAALNLMKGVASETAYEEFEFRCGSTGPHIPVPKRGVLTEQ